MKIGISLLNFRPGHIGGTETYLREILKQFASLISPTTIVCLATSENATVAHEIGNFQVVVLASERKVTRQRILDAMTPLGSNWMAQHIASLGLDVLWFPQQSIFPRGINGRCCLTVHDLQHVFFPGNFSIAERFFRWKVYGRSLRRANRLIAISEFTKQELVRTGRVRAEQIAVIPHGQCEVATDTIVPYDDHGGPYIFYPAASFPHKGHIELVQSVGELVSRNRFPFRLFLSGRTTSHWKKVQNELVRRNLESVVFHLGYLPYDRVLRLVKGCAAMVFPSRYEGFGLPVLEAAALSKKMITSRLEVFQEIGVPECCRIDFCDASQLERSLSDLTFVPLTRRPLTSRQSAQLTLDVLTDIARDDRVLS